MLSNLRSVKKVEATLIEICEGDGALYPYQTVTYALIDGKIYPLTNEISLDRGEIEKFLLTSDDFTYHE